MHWTGQSENALSGTSLKPSWAVAAVGRAANSVATSAAKRRPQPAARYGRGQISRQSTRARCQVSPLRSGRQTHPRLLIHTFRKQVLRCSPLARELRVVVEVVSHVVQSGSPRAPAPTWPPASKPPKRTRCHHRRLHILVPRSVTRCPQSHRRANRRRMDAPSPGMNSSPSTSLRPLTRSTTALNRAPNQPASQLAAVLCQVPVAEGSV